jgi:hypothetical protein
VAPMVRASTRSDVGSIARCPEAMEKLRHCNAVDVTLELEDLTVMATTKPAYFRPKRWDS